MNKVEGEATFDPTKGQWIYFDITESIKKQIKKSTEFGYMLQIRNVEYDVVFECYSSEYSEKKLRPKLTIEYDSSPIKNTVSQNKIRNFIHIENGYLQISNHKASTGIIRDIRGKITETIDMRKGLKRYKLSKNIGKGVYFLHIDQSIYRLLVK